MQREIVPTLRGGAVKALRERLGLSQEEMALELGMSPFTVSRWERRTAPVRGRWIVAVLDVMARLEKHGPQRTAPGGAAARQIHWEEIGEVKRILDLTMEELARELRIGFRTLTRWRQEGVGRLRPNTYKTVRDRLDTLKEDIDRVPGRPGSRKRSA